MINKPSKHIAKSIKKGPEIRNSGIKTIRFLKTEITTKNYILKVSLQPQVFSLFGFSKKNLEASLSSL